MSLKHERLLSFGTLITLAFFLVCSGCATPSGIRESRSIESEANAQLFDAAWQIIYESHYDTNFNGVDWQAVRTELRPKAKAAPDQEALREVIEEMLGRLGQSHMSLIPAEVAGETGFSGATNRAGRSSSDVLNAQPAGVGQGSPEHPERSAARAPDSEAAPAAAADGSVGMEVRLLNGKVVVFRVEPGGAAERAGVRPGWVLEAIDGRKLKDRIGKRSRGIDSRKLEFLIWRMATQQLLGPVGSEVAMIFRDSRDRRVRLTLERERQRGDWVKFGSMPPFYTDLESRWVEGPSGARIGLIRFNLWMFPIARLFDRAVDEFRSADGIVIDLRGNVGGIGAMIVGVSGHFLDERISLGTMKMRENELRFVANPRRVNTAGERVTPFGGPVAILVDSISLSAAEVFAGGMQAIGRAKIFGETTGGQALPAVWHRLPNGDVLYHVFADFVTPAGDRLEGRGVVPDVNCPLTRKDLLAGRDRALERAIDWIAEETARVSGRGEERVRSVAEKP